MDAVVELALTVRLTILQVEADPNAAGFYRRMGFRDHAVRPSILFEGRKLPVLRRAIGQAECKDDRDHSCMAFE